jgi:hypothetical protein
MGQASQLDLVLLDFVDMQSFLLFRDCHEDEARDCYRDEDGLQADEDWDRSAQDVHGMPMDVFHLWGLANHYMFCL